MVAPSGGARRALVGLLIATIAAGVALVVLIGTTAAGGVATHELAGAVLLVLLLGALVAAAPFRRIDPRPFHWTLGALAALVAMGVAGAALGALGAPPDLAFVPLIAFALLLIAAGDALRWSLRLPGRPTDGRAGA